MSDNAEHAPQQHDDGGAPPQIDQQQSREGDEPQQQHVGDREQRSAGGAGGERKGPPEIGHLVSVKIDNLTYDTQHGDIEGVFGKYGRIADVSHFGYFFCQQRGFTDSQ